MEWVNAENKIPIKSWCKDIEDGAKQQASNLANLPFVFKHIALMPDCHQGYGMPIGGVMATKNVIVPNAVGVDIGCGMIAVKTNFKYNDDLIHSVKKIFEGIRSNIPVGFSHHNKDQIWDGFDNAPDLEIIQEELDSAKKQLGTLGGGNHFIELQKGSCGNIWLMIHSGSRNFGLKIAKKYHNKAKELCEKWYSNIPNNDLAFLPMNTPEAQEYFMAMNYALDFALANRKLMMSRFCDVVRDELKCEFEDEINIHHNYAAYENHFNNNVIVHRKGATSAKSGQLGIIPGSQGTSSYIVRGLGNKNSFESCSHGAGRKMGRKEAQRSLSLEEEKEKLNSRGIVHSIKDVDDLDEASGAYKDIDIVMESQKDLVEIVVKLEPLGVVKG